MSQAIFFKSSISKFSFKILIWSIIIISLVLISLVIWGEINYKKGAQLRNGISALKGGDYSLAYKEILPSAKNGNSVAQALLGDIHAFGWGVPVDEIKAEIWYRRAERNCSSNNKKVGCLIGESEYRVAKCYLTGCYGKIDPLIAKKWLIRSAEAGHLEAQQFLTDPSKLDKYNLKINPKILTYWKDYFSSDK